MQTEQDEKIVSNNQTITIFTEEDTKGFQCKKFFFTYHLIGDEQFEQAFKRLEPLKALCDKYIWGEEYGKSGSTPHIQGAFILKAKMRATTIQKEFFLNNAHLPKLKNWNLAFQYCQKEGNKIETNMAIKPKLNILKEEALYIWQKDLIKILKSEPNDRDILWYWGSQGCGKTQFIKYCVETMGAIILNGKPSDMKNGIVEYEKKMGIYPTIIFSNIGFDKDLERIHYSGYEDIKDMCFYSGKYEGGMVVGNNPHLIIFANGEPITTNEKFIVTNI